MAVVDSDLVKKVADGILTELSGTSGVKVSNICRFFYYVSLSLTGAAFLNGRCSDQSKRALSRLYVILNTRNSNFAMCAYNTLTRTFHAAALARNNVMHCTSIFSLL